MYMCEFGRVKGVTVGKIRLIALAGAWKILADAIK